LPRHHSPLPTRRSSDLHVEEAKFPPPNERGLWVRIPMQFPFAQPHGIVTKEPLVPTDGHAVKGHNASHEMCNPVGPIGGGHYYRDRKSTRLNSSHLVIS